VQHAHQKGIIHRDIKPSNVLVMESDGAPVCKIIDFGIAKATAPLPGWSKLTGTGMVIGTPAYMSPEQFDSGGVDIDTRSDIYSLGVLLYELAAGVLPIGGGHSGKRPLLAGQLTGDVPAPSVQYGALAEQTRKALADERRTDPSTLRRTLSGDLDCIILKALENDRDHRYATANAMAADIERYLTDEPVAARASTATYRAQKFARRHRMGVGFAATLVVLLAAVAVGATVQARRLAVANGIARARQGQAEELIDFMLGDLRTRLDPIGKLDLLDEVGKKALSYFAAVPETELSDDELFRRAQAVQQLGTVRLAQGKLPEAAALMKQSIALVVPLVARDSANPRWQLGLAHNHFYAGSVDWARGNVDSALAHFRPFVRISDRLMAQYPESLAYRAEVAYALNNIGFSQIAKGDTRAGLTSYEAALAIMSPLVGRDTTNAYWVITLGALHNASGVARRKLGDLTGALREHTEELAIKQGLAKRDTANREWQRHVAIAHSYLSDIQLWTGDTRQALANALAARAIYTSLVAHDSANVSWGNGAANNHSRIAQILLEQHDADGALRELDAAKAALIRLSALAPANASSATYQRETIGGGTARARALMRLGRAADARAPADQAIAAGESALGRKAQDLEYRRLLADAYIVRGEALDRPGSASFATTSWARALVLVDSLARTSKETEFLALQAAAILRLHGKEEALPIVGELLRRGYRRPSFVELLKAHGIATT
jgi:serine/threonine-protein kinase